MRVFSERGDFHPLDGLVDVVNAVVGGLEDLRLGLGHACGAAGREFGLFEDLDGDIHFLEGGIAALEDGEEGGVKLFHLAVDVL